MNLKKAFRYQTLINKIVEQVYENGLREDLFKTINVTYKKSELNTYALNKTYEDETKIFHPGEDLSNDISPILVFGYSGRTKDSTEVYDPIIAIRVLKYLLDEKVKVSEAIFKAKNKVKITPIGFQGAITYDSAISLAALCRKHMSKTDMTISKLKNKTLATTASAQVLVSADQPLAPVNYKVEINVTVDQDAATALNDYDKEISIFVEDLSDKIEAASLSANVNYETDLAVLDNFDSLYHKFLSSSAEIK